MANMHSSNLLKIDYVHGANGIIPCNVTITAKARHCLKEVFDSFLYLQLVVDDFMLPIPNTEKVLNFFKYRQALNYEYLVSNPAEYTRMLKEMFALKVRQVAVFLKILENSQIFERRLYKDVYDEMESRYAIGAFDVKAIAKTSVEEMMVLERHLSQKDKEFNFNVSEAIEESKSVMDETDHFYKELMQQLQ
jgi:hypothetical protein